MFGQPFAMQNPVQNYPWGSHTAIAALTGQPVPSPKPQAEIWMGGHPKAPSRIFFQGDWQPLDRLIERFAEPIMGATAVERFGRRLPYLFKVLAAAEPLSIQAHPDRRQAVEGFARENRAGLAMDGPRRNYRDDNHKPELICALSEFWALNGFRPVGQMRACLRELCPEMLGAEIDALGGTDPSAQIRTLFSRLMTMNEHLRQRVIDEAAGWARGRQGEGEIFRWVASLHQRYARDIGILAPALLNLVCLQPGEAMFLPAGRLHAYLEGTGIEIMANSDNVLRGGLTTKHVDVAELLRVLRFEGCAIDVLRADDRFAGRYPSAAQEFELWRIETDSGRSWQSPPKRCVEILLCTEGAGQVTVEKGRMLDFKKGASILVPAAAGAYRLSGTAVVFRAALPERPER